MDVVVVLDNLGTDETLFKVGVDDTCTLGCLPSLAEGPCLNFHLTGGDEGLKGKKTIDGLDETIATALGKTHILEEHLLLFVSLEFGNVGLGLCTDDEHLCILVLDGLGNTCGVLVAGRSALVVYITYIEHWLGGEEEERLGSCNLVLGVEANGACTLAFEKNLAIGVDNIHLYLCCLVATNACCLLYTLGTVLKCLEVLQLKFHIDDFLIADRIHTTVDMNDA